jgi:hypothetical protein
VVIGLLSLFSSLMGSLLMAMSSVVRFAHIGDDTPPTKTCFSEADMNPFRANKHFFEMVVSAATHGQPAADGVRRSWRCK